ncbi:TIGR04141 family sporadically distributed protein [Plantibacter flavus]|uniref:DUF6119 family protein n=1 Tax=Plantibacter flavus TaxID=150123 RepID=UPI003F16BD57
MAAKAGITVPIYRIDVQGFLDVLGEEVSLTDVPRRLVQSYNTEKSQIVYRTQGHSEIDGHYIELFHNVTSQPQTSAWVKFFESSGIDLPEIASQFQQLLCFVVIDAELYAFTAGQAAVVFERYVDIAFPLEVGRRVAKGEVRSARANQITGRTLMSDQHFRDPRRITLTESLDTVWSSLSGDVRAEWLADGRLQGIFGLKKKMRISVTGSVRLGPKVESLEKMVALVTWLGWVVDEALPVDDAWGALDAIKALNSRKQKRLIERLRIELARQIFVEKRTEDLALSHADVSFYTGASEYVVTDDGTVLAEFEVEPTLREIVDAATVDGDRNEQALESIIITSANEDYGAYFATRANLAAHLHGELRMDNKTYFLLSGRWYEVDATFIDSIKREFVELAGTLDLERQLVGLRDWRSEDPEGVYNTTSIDHSFSINGDTILTDNIELFDTLSFAQEGVLHILHVKRGFNVKIRDVRSQLLASAQLIENDLRTGGKKLRAHHGQLVAKGRTELSEDAFVELFTRSRVYGLCYATERQISASSASSFRSSVAKMELVSLNAAFRQLSSNDLTASFRLIWIPIVP